MTKPNDTVFNHCPINDHWVIFVTWNGSKYVFRYAYDTEKQAIKVQANLKAGFGKPVDEYTDIRMNYWRYDPRKDNLQFVQRTTQKNSWYILQPE